MKGHLIKSLLFVGLCLNALFYVACSGNTDDTLQIELTISPDKNSLKADGKEVITFTVKQAGTDVTADAIIRNIKDNKQLAGNTFSTTTAGTYTFEASLNGVTSPQTSVTATKASIPTSKFARRICGMEFTGTWCALCPEGMTRLNYLIGADYEDVVHLIAVHADGTSPDPMATEHSETLASKFKITAYPSCVVDMREVMKLSVSYDAMRTVFNASLNNYPAHCGVAISSVYTPATSQAIVKVKVTSEKAADYRLVLYVLEDGLKYKQNDGGLEKDATHNHVLRDLVSETINGDKLGQIAADKEVTKEYTVTLDPTWKPEKLSFYAMAMDENGNVNNIAICDAVNGNTDYKYLDD